jgi:glycosyltransferase involved in cell wall biosynthesis
MKLSIVISAFNEENKIEACLKSAGFADEIVVVDNSSTDKTAEIARKYTKHVYTQKNDPSAIDIQKNFAIEKATGDWILIVDADELVTTELAEEITKVIKSPSIASNATGAPLRAETVNGFWIPRKNIIFGKWIEHTGWYPDLQLRLFRKGKGKFEKAHVHEPLVVEGETTHLKEHLLHRNYESVSQFLSKSLLIYAPNEADDLLSKGYIFNYRDIIKFPLKEFLSRYFAREGYKDGFHGLVLSLLMAFYHFVIFLYLWEKKDFAELSQEDVKEELKDEYDKSKKDLMYWIAKMKITEEKSELKKMAIKLKRKLNL